MPNKPLAVYIHWPFCKSKCPYCDFNSHVREQVDQARWREALLRELEYMAGHVPDREVKSIFFGGGTPSLMPPETAAALIERVRQLWPVSSDIEITLEANPTSVEANTFSDFKAAGVNRVSLGVQSLDDKELKFLGREHSAKEALAAVSRARDIFPRYSFDLIYARPNQTVESWRNELHEALAHVGGHFSLYQLTIEENTAFHHAYKKGNFTLPDEETGEALYRLTEDMLAEKGLLAYEVSNYARPGEASRHNLAYWQGDEYIGVGPGAHGRVSVEQEARSGDRASPQRGEATAPGENQEIFTGALNKSRTATATLKSPERWLEAVARDGHGVEIWQAVDKEEEIAELVMMGLRLTDGIKFQDFKAKTGVDFKSSVNMHKYALYVQKNLLKETNSGVAPTLEGRLVLNRLTSELLLDQ